MSKEYLCINDKVKYETKGSTPKYVDDSGTIVLNQKCVRNGMIDYSFAQYISDQQNIVNEKYVKIGDVLLNSTGQGTAGRCAFVDYLPENYKVTVDSHMLILRFENMETARFFAYSLYNQENYILELLTGSSGQGELDREIVYNISFPYSEKNIAIFNKLLIAINNKIKKNNKINSELGKMAKDLYDYWFIQFDFPDENGKPYKSSGGKMVYDEKLKRNIPHNWSVNNIKSCIEHINIGLNPRDNFVLNNGNIKYITVKNLTTHGCIDFSNCDTIDKIAQKIIHKRSDISKGDILFASIAPLGRCYLIQEDPQTWDINESVFSIRPKNTVPSEYLYMFLMSETFVKKAENSSTGSVFAGIRIKTLEDMTLIIPDDNILQQFKEKISKMLLQKYIKECENQKLTELRDFLLPMLMNGQITIVNLQQDNLSEEKILKKSLEFWQTHGKMNIDQFARENGILVYKDNEQKKGAVSYNEEKDLYEIAVKDPRDNFTIAHEIGHILKHKKELKTGTLGRKSEESGTKIMEYEADSLAAEILMPEEYVLQYMQDKNKKEKDYLDEKFIRECAKYFNVNPPAMNIRLKNLGYKVPCLK